MVQYNITKMMQLSIMLCSLCVLNCGKNPASQSGADSSNNSLNQTIYLLSFSLSDSSVSKVSYSRTNDVGTFYYDTCTYTFNFPVINENWLIEAWEGEEGSAQWTMENVLMDTATSGNSIIWWSKNAPNQIKLYFAAMNSIYFANTFPFLEYKILFIRPDST
jgi:hypothetical protein